MTRVNTIDPKFLLDQHLTREYQEITRVSSLARAYTAKDKVPKEYVLGTGHVLFFYDKGEFLRKRCELLYAECKRRGFNVEYKEYRPHPEGLNNDWNPSLTDHLVNLSRLQEKLDMKPDWYKYLRDDLNDPYHYQNLPCLVNLQ